MNGVYIYDVCIMIVDGTQYIHICIGVCRAVNTIGRA